MTGADNIQYLQNHEIDRARWDACIDRSTNALIYAYSFYLDKVCDNWDAIIIDDYKAVMPLPWRKKMGITYIYPPPFIQQMGIFSNADVSNLLPQLLQLVKSKFSFGEYYFNYFNHHSVTRHFNFTLDLSPTYVTIKTSYKNDLIKNLKKAKKNNLFYSSSNDYKKAILLHHSMYVLRMPHIKEREISDFIVLCKYLQNNNCLLIREVTNKEGALLTISLCLKHKNRIYLWLSTTTDLGRKLKANHFLHDRLIHEFSEYDMILDFVGSDIPGICHFYENFGAVNQPYFFYRWNNLPWPFKFLKKPTTV